MTTALPYTDSIPLAILGVFSKLQGGDLCLLGGSVQTQKNKVVSKVLLAPGAYSDTAHVDKLGAKVYFQIIVE